MTVVDKEHVLLYSFDIFIFLHCLVILKIVINVFHQGGNFRSHTMLYVEGVTLKSHIYHSFKQGHIQMVLLG